MMDAKPMPTEELTMDEILSRVNDNRKMLIQNGISELSRSEFEEQIAGGLLAQVGAWVISVEGESWKEGMNIIDGRARLGRFVKSEQFNELTKITFSTPPGLFYPGTGNLLPFEKRIQHPLSKAGFYVPSEGGFLSLEDGLVLLVSKTGIFSGKGGWDKAREMHSQWTWQVANNQQLKDRNHALTQQLQHTESMLMTVSASREDFQLWAEEQKMKFRTAWDTLGKVRDQISSLHSQCEGLQWVNAGQEQTIKETFKYLDSEVRELRAWVMDDKMFDTIQQATNRVPDMSVWQKQNYAERLKRVGVVRQDPQEKLIAEQKKLIDELEQKIKQQSEKSQEQQSRPEQKKDEEEDDGDSEGIVDATEDDEEETQEQEAPQTPPPKPPKTESKPKKTSFTETIKNTLGKGLQDAKDAIGKSVSKTPKEEKPKEEKQSEESQEEPADDNNDDEAM